MSLTPFQQSLCALPPLGSRQLDIRTFATANAMLHADQKEASALLLIRASGVDVEGVMNHRMQRKRKEDLRERLRRKAQAKKQ